jgi:uncharacterized protein YjbJ (UPF0337 family)
MNWDHVEGKWNQYKGQAKERWRRLTEDDLDIVNGKREQLVGGIQERYGFPRQIAEMQVNEFLKILNGEDAAQGKKYSAGHDLRQAFILSLLD